MLYGYARVSTQEQVDGTSLDDQRRKVQGVALIRGEGVAEVFEDRGVSGSVPLSSRPAGSRLLDVLQPGDVVVASRLDRVFRDAQDALTVSRELRERGVDLILTDIGTEPANRDGIGRLFLTIMSAVGEFERYRIKERQADGIRSKRGAGGFTGGTRPFGWNVEGEGKGARLVPIETEQLAIETIRTLRASGASFRTIRAAVADAGHSVGLATVKRIIDREAA